MHNKSVFTGAATALVANLMLLMCLVAIPTTAFSDTIIADNAFEVFGNTGVGTGPNDGIGDMGVGDTTDPASPGRRGVVRFSLAGLAGQTLQSATLNLKITQSRRNHPGTSGNTCDSPIIDGAAPFTNPGLGDTNVVHIADPGTPDATDYQSASIGNDPGTLIATGVEPPSLVSIDVTAAMQERIGNGASFIGFRIQTATETDYDGCNDVWFIRTEEFPELGGQPFIEVEVEANCDPRTQGYWYRQCLGIPGAEGGIDPGRNGLGPAVVTEPDFGDLVASVESILQNTGVEFAPACAGGMDADPPSDPRERAIKQYTALLFNLESDRLQCGDIDVSPAGCSSTTVGDLRDEIASLIIGGDYKQAAACAAFANEGF